MYVEPKILKEDAYNLLSQSKVLFLFRLFKRKKTRLRKVELIYLPYSIVELVISQNGEQKQVAVLVDGLLGNISIFDEEGLTYLTTTENVVCDFRLSIEETQKIAIEQYRWILLELGLKSKQIVSIENIVNVTRIYYPFWVGYFKKSGSFDFTAIDAVGGRLQGIKMRKIIIKALRKIN